MTEIRMVSCVDVRSEAREIRDRMRTTFEAARLLRLKYLRRLEDYAAALLEEQGRDEEDPTNGAKSW